MLDLATLLQAVAATFAIAVTIPTVYYFYLMTRAGVIEALKAAGDRRAAAKRARLPPPNVEIAVVEE